MREEDKLMTEQGQVLEKKPYNLRERNLTVTLFVPNWLMNCMTEL